MENIAVVSETETLNAAICRVQNEISHTCDGPVTAFVLISRAMDLAAKGGNATVLANALDAALIDFGYLSTEKL